MKSELDYKKQHTHTPNKKTCTVGGCAQIHCNPTLSIVVTWCEMGPQGKKEYYTNMAIISPPTCILVNALISQRMAEAICFSCKMVTEHRSANGSPSPQL